MEFKQFAKQIQDRFNEISKDQKYLFLAKVNHEEIWNVYLNSFPEVERQGFNCNCCKRFIKHYGNIVAIIDNQIQTLWDITTDAEFQPACDALDKLVKSKVQDILVSKVSALGEYSSLDQTESGLVTWYHLCLTLPDRFVFKSSETVASIRGSFKTSKEVLQSSLTQISTDAVETVLELIMQNSLYRGAEAKEAVIKFRDSQRAYLSTPRELQDNWCWSNLANIGPAIARMKNTAIGTLLVDISEGRELDEAVSAYERIMAPANYKRPTALITKAMIEQAQKDVESLGLLESLPRRHATIDDITVNNVLHANRDAKRAMDIFGQLKEEVTVNPKKFGKVTEIGIDDFLANVLPTATKVELLVDNSLTNNLMTLTAPVNKEAPALFKWGNGFSWSYNGDVADSIKEQVKAAGGKVDGELRCSLSWFNFDDLDIHVIEPSGEEISFRHKLSKIGGKLDVDMNAGGGHTRKAVENIIWANKSSMLEGKYKLVINNFTKREDIDYGFIAEIECHGELFVFKWDKQVADNKDVLVAEFNYSKEKGVEIVKSIPLGDSSRDIWGIKTMQFQEATLIMNSPNYWDEKEIGNKHFFFILAGCKNPGSVRGFYNEYLRSDLDKHRKVFEVLGDKMKAPYVDSQLSGLGFSSTVRNSVYCRVTGAMSRIIKINF